MFGKRIVFENLFSGRPRPQICFRPLSRLRTQQRKKSTQNGAVIMILGKTLNWKFILKFFILAINSVSQDHQRQWRDKVLGII
jgi:hypothetical protein